MVPGSKGSSDDMSDGVGVCLRGKHLASDNYGSTEFLLKITVRNFYHYLQATRATK